MYIIIVGCGSLGAHLASELSREGQDVVTVDQDEAAFRELSAEYSGFTITGDATEVDVLLSARIQDADVVVACTENDSVNLMIAQIAKKLHQVPVVMARVFNPARQDIYKELGIDTLCATTLAAMEFKRTIMNLEKGS